MGNDSLAAYPKQSAMRWPALAHGSHADPLRNPPTQARPMHRAPLLLISFALVCLMPGCASAKWNPLNMIFGRQAATVEKTEKKESVAEDRSVTAAQVEIVKTGEALKFAAESPAVAVARRTNTNALNLLNQRQPLNLLQTSEATSIVAGLLSEEASKRQTAEARQQAAEGKNAALSIELDAIRSKLDEARKNAAAEAASNLALANELRVQKLWTYCGYAASFLATCAALYFQFGGAKAEKGLASLMAHVRTNYGETAGDAASAAADWALLEGQQSKIFQMAAIMAAKSKAKTSQPTSNQP
jgi:hypothetical protein